MTKNIKPRKLTAENFAPFGDVIEVNDAGEIQQINQGNTDRYNDLAAIDVCANGGRPLVNIFRSKPVSLPFPIYMMERHPLSSQAFIPLSQQPFLVVVAPAGEFDKNKISVFIAQANQGVNYRAGTWHHYSLALNTLSDFLVIDRGYGSKIGDEKNCDEVSLDGDLVIVLELS